jgi:hypothetical protein
MHDRSQTPADAPAVAIDWRVVGAALVALALTVALLVMVLPGRLAPSAVRITVAPTPGVSR